jgi:hypothetical protein
MPGDVGARVTVQQQDRRPRAAVAYPQLRLADVDSLQCKAFEHESILHHEVALLGALSGSCRSPPAIRASAVSKLIHSAWWRAGIDRHGEHRAVG